MTPTIDTIIAEMRTESVDLSKHPAWRHACIRFADKLSLAALPAPGEGFVLVPREPTRKMFKAMIAFVLEDGEEIADEHIDENMEDFATSYRAMIAAAPLAAAQGEADNG